MKELTLLIPAKHESESLPLVLDELKNYECKKLIVLDENDIDTINAIKNFDCEVLFQKNKGYGSALIEGIKKIGSDYICIFNADGSFDPKYLKEMLNECKSNSDFVFSGEFLQSSIGNLDTQMIRHFFKSLAMTSRMTLHMSILYGINDHHKCEGLFKAFGRALRQAVEIDPRRIGVASTKGTL